MSQAYPQCECRTALQLYLYAAQIRLYAGGVSPWT